ncbi:MAG: hypothetical protein WKF89_13220 [Chitinophagaceae bacterium]
MNDLDPHIQRITEKLQQLLKNYAHVVKENEKLKIELLALKSNEKEKDNRLQLLALRIEVLKAAKGEMTADEKITFEKTINQYLREIDSCLALINE